MIPVKNAVELNTMRRVCRVTAEICGALADCVGPGTTTRDLDDYAGELAKKAGGKSAFLGYRGFPGNICVSINEEVVHGLPGRRRIRPGDLVSLDVGLLLEGFVGDMATTVMVAPVAPDVENLVAATRRALDEGMKKACSGRHLSDISHAVERCAKSAGFEVVRDFVGHGVGREMHEEPQIPNFGPAGRGPKLKAGMTLAIEPMVNMGSYGVKVLDDGWTVVTLDGKPSAHFEHTVAVGDDGPEVLTCAERKK